MNTNRVFFATTGNALSRAEKMNDEWQVDTYLPGMKINCLVADPFQVQRVYAGTQKDGVLVSDDAGKTWQSAGMKGIPVKSLAVSRHQPETIYAGCKPVSIYLTRNGGESWQELEGMRRSRRWWWFSPADPPGWTPYVQALTISPTDPDLIMAGIELGGVLRSADGGKTWSKHRRGALLDCHSLKFHSTNGNWVYEGGAGGASFSQDRGKTWRRPKAGLDKKYGWMVSADPNRPEVWYLSASPNPNLLRGEFNPPAHIDGRANANIYRSNGGAAWEKLTGGLPDPLNNMAYALVTDPGQSGFLYAGLSNGDVWFSNDYGDSWKQMPFNLGGIHHTLLMI